MATKKKMLQAAAGNAAASGGGGAGALNVEDVFSTYIYEGNGIGKRIENGINLGDGTEEETIIHLTGDNITDSGPNSISLTNSGVASSGSIKKFGTASLYFDANSSSRLTATDASLNLGGGDYTVEMWLYINDASGTKGIFAFSNPSDDTVYDIGMFHSSNGLTWQSRYTPVSSNTYNSGSNVITNNTWHHVALVRYNNYHYMYIDGTLQGTPVDVTGQATAWNHLKLGTHWDNQYCFTGRIDEFRVTRKALYTANFTPPTAAFSTSYTSTTGEGGMVWFKSRTGTDDWHMYDSERGTGKRIASNLTNAQYNGSSTYGLTSFNSNGFSVGTTGAVNNNGSDLASWTFRKAPKFFDVVTYTGTGSSLTIDHDLGVEPAVIIIKRTNTTGNWIVFTDVADGSMDYLYLNTTDASADGSALLSKSSTSFTLLQSFLYGNASGSEYVAYLFAHNDGDGEFGPDGDADIIKCGSYTGNGTDQFIDLGFEPQWVMIKDASTGGTYHDWYIFDSMRKLDVSGSGNASLMANLSDAEGGAYASSSYNLVQPTPTGMIVEGTSGPLAVGTNGDTYIYIAIRRGPMAVPTDATDVFAPVLGTDTTDWKFDAGFPVDLHMYNQRASTGDTFVFDRVRGGEYLRTNQSDAGASFTADFDYMNYVDVSGSVINGWMTWNWKRAPNFFDVVAYTGNGTAGRTVSHNLGVAPEMIWVKKRSGTGAWPVYHVGAHASSPENYFLQLNSTITATLNSARWNNTAPTATEFTVGNGGTVNDPSVTYIAYLFASLDGVSKVGSYTGNGTGQNIDCGFSSGARFVLIKNITTAKAWFVFDTERGITTGNDPYLKLNDTSAEGTTFDLVDPYSNGFAVTGSNSGINASGDTYIFYAIA